MQGKKGNSVERFDSLFSPDVIPQKFIFVLAAFLVNIITEYLISITVLASKHGVLWKKNKNPH